MLIFCSVYKKCSYLMFLFVEAVAKLQQPLNMCLSIHTKISKKTLKIADHTIIIWDVNSMVGLL